VNDSDYLDPIPADPVDDPVRRHERLPDPALWEFRDDSPRLREPFEPFYGNQDSCNNQIGVPLRITGNEIPDLGQIIECPGRPDGRRQRFRRRRTSPWGTARPASS